MDSRESNSFLDYMHEPQGFKCPKSEMCVRRNSYLRSTSFTQGSSIDRLRFFRSQVFRACSRFYESLISFSCLPRRVETHIVLKLWRIRRQCVRIMRCLFCDSNSLVRCYKQIWKVDGIVWDSGYYCGACGRDLEKPAQTLPPVPLSSR